MANQPEPGGARGAGPTVGAPQITEVRLAAGDHIVTTVEGGRAHYRRQPCAGCPWRVDQTGVFPPEAFRLSARTAYDNADGMFGCHESGTTNPTTCAGFLLRGATHNWAWRRAIVRGWITMDEVGDGGHELHPSYRAMAIANGVDPADHALARCRDD